MCDICCAGIWKQLGNLNGQQKGMLEERFKTVDRELGKKGLAPGYRKAAFEANAAAANSLRSSQDGLHSAAAAPGAAGSGAAAGFYQVPGQLSSTAGLISLSAAADAPAGMRRPADAPNFSLQTAECGAGSQHPSMLLTGPPGRGLAAGSSTGAPADASAVSVQIPEAAAAAGGQLATPANPGPTHYQPLQSFNGQVEIYAEWDKCLAVLQHGGCACLLACLLVLMAGRHSCLHHGANSWTMIASSMHACHGGDFSKCTTVTLLLPGPMEEVIEVMKLLCYEMMDLQRTHQQQQLDRNTVVAPSAQIVWQLLLQQSDTLVTLLTLQTQQVRFVHRCSPC